MAMLLEYGLNTLHRLPKPKYMHNNFLVALLILTITVPVVALFRGLRIPSVLAYLLIGAAASPHQLGLVQPDAQLYELGELGVVFLMFSIGLEFNLARLMGMRGLVFGLGLAQVTLTITATMLVAMAFGIGWQGGLGLGGAVAMSSTAIVARLLSERLEVHSAHGRQVMGVLLFQDVAVVPLLILIPSLASPGDIWTDLSLAMVKATVVLMAVFVVGKRLVQPLFSLITKHHSTELFMLNVLWVLLGMAALTQLAGLSLALGAFLGGMLISETMYRHQVGSDIRPFRDILLGLFFITIGMQLNLPAIGRDAGTVMAILAGLLVGKAVIIILLSLALRSNPVTAMRVGVQLSFAGEFGFVLLNQLGELHLLNEAIAQDVLAAMLISMMLGPLLVHKSRHMVKALLGQSTWASQGTLDQIVSQSDELTDHVIVCGYGRTGKSLVSLLEREGIPSLTLELDGMQIAAAEDKGKRIAFGDAGRKEVMVAAGVARARAVVITHNDLVATMRTLAQIRASNPNVPVIVRVTDDQGIDRIKNAGATEVVPEIQECSLMLAAQTLLLIGTPREQVDETIQRVRSERYNLSQH